eukprot:m.548708 g.548708  ORF g.548708 m.548708 type:complete len:71 (-) comp57718_c0_seq2:695-907(-)
MESVFKRILQQPTANPTAVIAEVEVSLTRVCESSTPLKARFAGARAIEVAAASGATGSSGQAALTAPALS